MSTPSSILLQERDREIVGALATKVRLVTAKQVARAWWPASRTAVVQARTRLTRLARAGLIQSTSIHSHPELPLTEPVLVWRPGDPTPRFGAVSQALRSRWREPIITMTAFVATRSGGRLFGGRGGSLKRPLQATHDLHVTTVFLRAVQDRPEVASAWRSEDIIAPSRVRQKLPDAMVFDAGVPLFVIEFGGEYNAARVEKVHVDCVKRRLPYELW